MRAPDSSDSGTPQEPPTNSTVLLLLGTIADTTWRMFAPTLGGTGLGLLADSKFGSSPWLGLAGLMIGIIVTAVLIRQQLRKVN